MALPLPKVVSDVGPGGGVVTAMRGNNALSQDMFDSIIKQAQAQYAPYTAYADAASKLAYSQFVGPQAIASILTNPNTRGMFTPEQYQNLSNAFSRQVGGTGSALANLPIPQGRSGGLLNALAQKIGLGSGSQQGMLAMSSEGGAPVQQPSGNNALQNIPGVPQAVQGQPGSDNSLNMTPQTIPQNNGSQNQLPGGPPTYNRAATGLPQGVFGASNPAAIIQAGEEGLKTQSVEEAKAIADQWKTRQDDINTQVNANQEMSRQLDKLSDARGRLTSLEKGPVIGRLPAMTTAAQDSDIAISNLVAARLKAWQSNRITNMDIGFGQMLKPGRYMLNDSFHNEVNYGKGLTERTQEYPAFAQRAQQAGLTPAQADAVWARYANEKPFFDPKSKQILGGNMGTWENYLSPQSVQETFSPTFKKQMDNYRKNMAGGNPDADEKINQNYDEFKSKPSAGAVLLAKQIKFPPFKNKEEFQQWYRNQPSVAQQAIRIKLGGK